VLALARAVTVAASRTAWAFREQSLLDFGIDALEEEVDDGQSRDIGLAGRARCAGHGRVRDQDDAFTSRSFLAAEMSSESVPGSFSLGSG
jgi:hypothetical protein